MKPLHKINPIYLALLFATGCGNDSNFKLEEAYKSPPVVFSKGFSKHLYGKTQHSTYAAISPNYFNALLEINDKEEIEKKRAEKNGLREADKVPSGTVNVAIYDGLPSGNTAIEALEQEKRKHHRIKEILEQRLELLNQILADTQKEIGAITAESDRRRKFLLDGEQLLVLSENTRIEVLDISGRYAKVKILEGKYKSKAIFIPPDTILVR